MKDENHSEHFRQNLDQSTGFKKTNKQTKKLQDFRAIKNQFYGIASLTLK